MTPARPDRIQDGIDNELPMPPKWFDQDRLDKYHSLGHKVKGIGVWHDVVFDAFVMLVDNLIGYNQAAEILAEEGQTATGKQGETVRHPMLIAKNTYLSNVKPLLVEFGLTPSAMKTLGVERGSSIDPMEELYLNNPQENTDAKSIH